jgi:hypothetical protein
MRVAVSPEETHFFWEEAGHYRVRGGNLLLINPAARQLFQIGAEDPVPGVWSAPFDRVCGSSAMLYFDADELPRDGRPDPELGFNLFQAHAYWPIVAEELGRPLEHIPFPAGVYVVNHSQNLSFGLQRAGTRTANVIASIERHAVTDREGILREEFGQE